MSETVQNDTSNKDVSESQEASQYLLYRVIFRKKGQVSTCFSKISNLGLDEIVMVKTDHGLEPAIIFKKGIGLPAGFDEKTKSYLTVVRRASRDEIAKYQSLVVREDEAFLLCKKRIDELSLKMKLISVERYFNGSKILFYFTSENRVDFRELVKKLVQEFRTRVEMKQIGVRHETKMIGGLGCCGRELCCSSFIGKFAPVSIKMAKEQDLPLNPVKISGVCNRLLCCLTHEYSTYKSMRKGMPRQGRKFSLDGKDYKIIQCNVLSETITAISNQEDGPITMQKEQWKDGVFEVKQPNNQPENRPQKQKNVGKKQDSGEKKQSKRSRNKKSQDSKGSPQKKKNQRPNKQHRQKK